MYNSKGKKSKKYNSNPEHGECPQSDSIMVSFVRKIK